MYLWEEKSECLKCAKSPKPSCVCVYKRAAFFGPMQMLKYFGAD